MKNVLLRDWKTSALLLSESGLQNPRRNQTYILRYFSSRAPKRFCLTPGRHICLDNNTMRNSSDSYTTSDSNVEKSNKQHNTKYVVFLWIFNSVIYDQVNGVAWLLVVKKGYKRNPSLLRGFPLLFPYFGLTGFKLSGTKRSVMNYFPTRKVLG